MIFLPYAYIYTLLYQKKVPVTYKLRCVWVDFYLKIKKNIVDMEKTEAKHVQKNPQEIYTWKAPLRAYKQRGKNILRFYLALALVLSLIVFFFGDRILLIPIWALVFLFYVYTITPPPEVENRLMKFGVESSGVAMKWEDLSHFYFIKRFGYDIVTIIPQLPYYSRLYFVLPSKDIKSKVTDVLSQHLIYLDKPRRAVTDKMIDILSHLVPDDEEEPTPSKAKKKS